MNSLRQVLKSVDGKPITNVNQTDVWRAETIHILCVGPVDRSYMVHDVLLEVPNSQLSIVTDYRELWVIPKQGAIHLVILHNTLSLFELEEACRFIRQQWPHARILVVRRGGGFLDDELYDDRVIPTVDSGVLFTTIERLTSGRHERRFGNAEL
jgi:hypothetical protein